MYFNIKEIDAAELAQLVSTDTPSVKIIDVREMNEINAGTIPGAIPMPLATVPVRVHELDKQTQTIFICRSGARSAQACAFLQQQGFDNVHNLRGGMFAWAGTGQPVALPQSN